jgi:hypothetical protein
MPAMSDPWFDILASGAEGEDSLKRVAAEHPLDFWWGRDHSNRCLLVLDYLSPRKTPRFPDLSGISVETTRVEPGNDRIVLSLLDVEDRDIFLALCNDLLAATAKLDRSDSARGLEIVIARLGRWQQLFTKRRNRLSFQEVIGLFGELVFLERCLLARLPVSSALAMWRGPYGDEQDFVVGGTIVEVKTQLASSDHALLISSENQLDTTSAPITIIHQVLGPAPPNAGNALSLNALIEQLRARLANEDADALAAFDAGLLAANYVPLPVYDEPIWLLVRSDAYRVAEGFPRITPAQLEAGVECVRYRVRLESCLAWRVDTDEFLKDLLDG